MRKDIEIPKAKNVQIVAVREWNEEFTEHQWNVYVVNNRKTAIEAVLVMSRGKSDDRKTSTLRHGLGDLQPQASAKVEFIASEVLGFTNEYLLTFFADGKLYERNFVFAPNSISEENAKPLPGMDQEGILAQ